MTGPELGEQKHGPGDDDALFRVRAFLRSRTKAKGLDAEIITAYNDHMLRASDIQTLVDETDRLRVIRAQILALHLPRGRSIRGLRACEVCTPTEPYPCLTARIIDRTLCRCNGSGLQQAIDGVDPCEICG